MAATPKTVKHLAPTPIPVDLLVKGANQIDAQADAVGMALDDPATEFEVREWKRGPARNSMIQFTAGDSFSIHSLVQLVERHQVPVVEQCGIVEKAVELVIAWAPRPTHESQDWARWRILEPHARFMWQQQCRHPLASPDPNLLNEFGGYLVFAQGSYAEAELLYQRAVLGAERTLGPNHPQTKMFRANWEDLRMSQRLPYKASNFHFAKGSAPAAPMDAKTGGKQRRLRDFIRPRFR